MTSRTVSVVLFIVSANLLVTSGYLVAKAFGAVVVFEAGGTIWEVLAALGTVGATVVALWLAARSIRRERDSVARLVSSWVSDEYVPFDTIPAYRRIVRIHLANESSEPVFDARVSVVVGQDSIPLGPLSAPTPIAVIPQRRELEFDISVPLLAHNDTWNPRVVLYFTDATRRRWMRDGDGELEEVTGAPSSWSDEVPEIDERQLGDMQTLQNPMMIALAFLAGVRADVDDSQLAVTLAPEAPGWANMDWQSMREFLDGYQPTSMVDYPAPYIARIKLSGDESLEGRVVQGEGLQLNNYRFLTLTYAPDRGWRVFAVGNHVRPDQILFPEGAFDDR